jgi:hypothetical protein
MQPEPVTADAPSPNAAGGTWFVRCSSLGFNSGSPGVFQWGLPGDAVVKWSRSRNRRID